jgi:predicted phage-related endonuclease
MGHNPWRSAYTAYFEAIGELPTDFEPSMAMKLGTVFEDPIRELWLEENKDWLTAHVTGTWQSVYHPQFRANPDAIIEWADGSLGILEIKFSRNPMNELPPHYRDQVMWYMHVLGLKKGILVAVANGDMVEHEIDYDPEYALQLEVRALVFLRKIEIGEAPDWDGSQSTYETVRTLSEHIYDGDIELGELYPQLMRAKEVAEETEQAFTLLKSKVLHLMDGVKVGLYQGDKVLSLQARGSGLPFIVFKRV